MSPLPPDNSLPGTRDEFALSPRPRNRLPAYLALICATGVVLGIANTRTGFLAQALGLGPQPPVSFRPLLLVPPGRPVLVTISGIDARGKSLKSPGRYLKRPRVEIFDEDLQLLASVKLERG
jgi:hypothetical protein